MNQQFNRDDIDCGYFQDVVHNSLRIIDCNRNKEVTIGYIKNLSDEDYE